MVSLQGKFKERSPIETVQIIKDFFAKRGFDLRMTTCFQSEAGTWTCHIDLYKNHIKLLGANGKGMTYDFCLASGHAELYERFCNMSPHKRNLMFMREYMKQNYEKNGYYILPGERYDIDIKDMLNAAPCVKHYYQALFKNTANLEKMIPILTDGKLIAAPYKNIANEDIIYMDPRILERVTMTCGEAGGNTLDEALVQAISEICEHLCTESMILNPQEKYYVVPNEKIANAEIIEKIQNIENLGYKIYIFDLSYNFNMPVVMSVLVNPYNSSIRCNWGSFPVFDIAVERVITELYQGIATYLDNSDGIEIPYKAFSPYEFLMQYGNNYTGGMYFNESIFTEDKIIYVDTSNKDIFRDPGTNEELLQYYIDLGKKFGYNFYYADMSKCDDIYAVDVFCPEFDISKGCLYAFSHMSDLVRQHGMDTVVAVVQMMNNITNILTENIDYTIIKQNIQALIKYYFDPALNGRYTGMLMCDNWDNLLPSSHAIFDFATGLHQYIDLSQLFEIVSRCSDNAYLYPRLRKYATIQSYIAQGYTNQEVIDIMAQFGHTVTQADFENLRNEDYIILNYFVEPTAMFYNSDLYHDIVQGFVK